MKQRRTTCVKRKLSAKDWHPSSIKHAVMEDRSSTQSFSNLQQYRHHRSFSLTLPNFQNSEVGYPISHPAQDSLEQYRNRGGESTSSYLTSNTSGPKRGASGGNGVLLSTSASSLEGDGSLGSHVDGENRLDSHFDDSWYGKKELWEDGESCEGAADDFHSKDDCYSNMNDVLYALNCSTDEGGRRGSRANHHNYIHVSCEGKSETVYNKSVNVSYLTKQNVAYNRVSAVSFNDKSVDNSRAASRASDGCFQGEEDYGSRCGSGEDQLQPAEAEGPWLSVSPTSQANGRWRGAADSHTLSSVCLSPIAISNRTSAQKLDSFSEAFYSQRKRLPIIPSENSSGQMWEFGVGRGESSASAKSRQSCTFDSDSYLPPSSSSSSSPAYPSLPSFPSPPTSSHLMSSVLSPPPTPLPPPSHSPSKTDSPSIQGPTGQSTSQGGDSLGGLQFFPSHIQSLPSVQSSGMIWKFPLLSHCFQPLSGNPASTDCHAKSSHADDYGNATGTCNIPQSSFTPSSDCSSLNSATGPSSNPSLNSPFHLPFRTSQISGKHHEAAEKTSSNKETQKIKNEPATRITSCLEQHPTPVYTGTLFASILQSRRTQNSGRYTPRPLLNPVRRGTGLYSSFTSLHHREEKNCDGLPHVNVGPDFQADLPPCFSDGEKSGMSFPVEESPREQLLWKPLDELEENACLQDQVEKLLSMCSSSCVPGGGSNTELALHYLHFCQGNRMATLEMLLFCQSSPTGDYHYSGCDFWKDTEKNLFTAALGSYGKDFSLIQKMVRTKTVSQCVEFYYLSKKLVDKQKKQKEDEYRDRELELEKSVTPISQPMERQFSLEEAVPVPPLASFFPCKLCGKMFYKIKSRNAHMKIHRQPQEDWADRRLQHQLLTQRLALNHPTNFVPSPGPNLHPTQARALTFSSSSLPSNNNSNAENIQNAVANSNPVAPSNASMRDSNSVTFSNITPLTPHVITISNIDGSDSNQREPTNVLPFHQTWGSFGQLPDLTTFYCIPEGKDDVGAVTVEGKDQIIWQ